MIYVTFLSIHVKIYSQLLIYKGTNNQESFKYIKLNTSWLKSTVFILIEQIV